jgi:hypothetical protein
MRSPVLIKTSTKSCALRTTSFAIVGRAELGSFVLRGEKRLRDTEQCERTMRSYYWQELNLK